MPEMRELYHELIGDHWKHPRNFGKLESANRQATGYNPLCGDRAIVYLQLEGGIVQQVQFQGGCCAICTASASLMTQRLKGQTETEAEALFDSFHNMATGGEIAPGAKDQLGKLLVFSGVKNFPSRVNCATLPWHTFRAALRGEPGVSLD